MDKDTLFDRRLQFPDLDAKERYSKLVGLDDIKLRIQKILGILIDPTSVERWQSNFHPEADNLLHYILRRPPLVVFAGDVGTGKSELSETIGDAVARQFDMPISLFPLSLSTRGSGRVGEMTQLISSAFEEVRSAGAQLKSNGVKSNGGIILHIDEADALAQSRENAQMHHEDRAGVNALLRGIDGLAESKLPVAVIMCTNRLNALDPAIQRRACEIVKFDRPNKIQRLSILSAGLSGLNFSEEDFDKLAENTGGTASREYGFTYSDLTQRLMPSIALEAYPDCAITAKSALLLASRIAPTPPFQEG